jgi:hypothetical protein
MHIKQTHISTARPNLLKEHVSPTHGLTGRKKHENTTRYIKHLAESANFKGGTLNKHCNGLIGNRSEMPNDFIYPTLYASEKDESTQPLIHSLKMEKD